MNRRKSSPQSSIKNISKALAISLALTQLPLTLSASFWNTNTAEMVSAIALAPAAGLASHYDIKGDIKKAALYKAIESGIALINAGLFFYNKPKIDNLFKHSSAYTLLQERDSIVHGAWMIYDAATLKTCIQRLRNQVVTNTDNDTTTSVSEHEALDTVAAVTEKSDNSDTDKKITALAKCFRIYILPISRALAAFAVAHIHTVNDFDTNPSLQQYRSTAMTAQSFLRLLHIEAALEKGHAYKKACRALLCVNGLMLIGECAHTKNAWDQRTIHQNQSDERCRARKQKMNCTTTISTYTKNDPRLAKNLQKAQQIADGNPSNHADQITLAGAKQAMAKNNAVYAKESKELYDAVFGQGTTAQDLMEEANNKHTLAEIVLQMVKTGNITVADAENDAPLLDRALNKGNMELPLIPKAGLSPAIELGLSDDEDDAPNWSKEELQALVNQRERELKQRIAATESRIESYESIGNDKITGAQSDALENARGVLSCFQKELRKPKLLLENACTALKAMA